MYNFHTFVMCPSDAPTGKPDVLLQSGCPDCMIIKGEDVIDLAMLLSKENRGII